MKGHVLIQLILIVLGTAGLLIFIFPVTIAVSVNPGNMTGCILSLILLGYGIFFGKVNHLLYQGWGNKGTRILLLSAGIFLGVLVMITVILTVCMIRASKDQPYGDETLVVLGCRVYGERPSLSLKVRMDAAYDYLKENPEAVCVLSGGKGSGEDISEAECMYRYLVKRGVSSERLFKEEKSTSTKENILYSRQIVEKNGLPEDIAVATNDYHQYRVKLIMRNLGMEHKAVSGKTVWWLLPTFYVRELYGILYQIIMA